MDKIGGAIKETGDQSKADPRICALITALSATLLWMNAGDPYQFTLHIRAGIPEKDKDQFLPEYVSAIDSIRKGTAIASVLGLNVWKTKKD